MTLNEANRVARAMERRGYTITALRQDLDGNWEVDGKKGSERITVSRMEDWHDDTPTAGRPPVYGERMTAHTIRMTAAQWAHVRQQGGDLSAGTRAIVQRDMEGGTPSIEWLHAERERINGLLLEAYRAKPEAKEAQ